MTRGELTAPGILVLDCSTARGSVAVATAGGATYWCAEFTAGRGHGGELFRTLEEALRQAGKSRDFEETARLEFAIEVARIAGADRDPSRSPAPPLALLSDILVGLGPGSYSGVRQAIAAANGLAMATGARLSGFASPLALRSEFPNYQAVGDARRGAYYYTAVNEGACVQGPELIENLADLQARLATRPDWPVLAVENVPPGLPPETPVVWPAAWQVPLRSSSLRRSPLLEPIYLRPVSITPPNPARLNVP